MIPASKRIATFAAGFRDTQVTAAQRHVVYRALLDTVAVTVAGRNDPASRIAEKYLVDVTGTGKASSWISGQRLPPESAAWLNGVAGHVLDYDDMLPPMRGHPSVAMLPALVALAQVVGADGNRLSCAYIAGFEVLARISAVMAIQHNTTGWHATSALGILGAVTACSVMLGLNEQQIVHALGLAVAQASGNRQNLFPGRPMRRGRGARGVAGAGRI
jgi:2-methylcitrate dehydratase PrpD